MPKKTAKRPRWHLCQCSEDCHARTPCNEPITRGRFIMRPDPFNGGHHPPVFVHLCADCERRLPAHF